MRDFNIGFLSSAIPRPDRIPGNLGQDPARLHCFSPQALCVLCWRDFVHAKENPGILGCQFMFPVSILDSHKQRRKETSKRSVELSRGVGIFGSLNEPEG